VSHRFSSYDIFRGILIIGMIFFHTFANFYSQSFNQNLYYWIPVGFMIFLGIIVGEFLSNKPNKTFKIGLKLITVFCCFNVFNIYINFSNISLLDFIFGNQQIFSMEILLPMSIFLFLVNLINLFKYKTNNKQHNKLLKIIFLLIILLTIIISDFINFYSYNLLFILYGLIGYLIPKILNIHYWVDYINTNKFKILNILLIIISFLFIYYENMYRIIAVFQVILLYICFSDLYCLVFKHMGYNSFFIYVFHIILIKLIKTFFHISTDRIGLILLIFIIVLSTSNIASYFLNKVITIKNKLLKK